MPADIRGEKTAATHGDLLTFGNHQIDDAYVPLGLVEQQKVTQRRENVAAEEGLNFYRKKQITQGFEHSKFREQVIQESSPKSNGKRLGIIGEAGLEKQRCSDRVRIG